MSYTGDPLNNPIDRVRLNVGDTDTYEEGLTDEVYQYVLDKNAGNEVPTTIECLKYLIAKYANLVTEKAGALFVKESEKYEQYKELLKMLVKDPTTAITKAGLPYAGGISVRDMDNNSCDPDNNQQKVTLSSTKHSYTNDYI